VAILTQRGFKEVCTYEDMAGAIFVLFLFGALLLLVSALQSFDQPFNLQTREGIISSAISTVRAQQAVSASFS